MKKAIGEKDAKIASLKQESANWQQEFTKMQKNNKKLRQQCDTQHSDQVEMGQLKREIASRDQIIASLQADLQKWDNEVTKLRSSLEAEGHSGLACAPGMESDKVSDLRTRIADKDKELKEL